jgi:hypothetical protein
MTDSVNSVSCISDVLVFHVSMLGTTSQAYACLARLHKHIMHMARSLRTITKEKETVLVEERAR